MAGHIDFITGLSPEHERTKEQRFILYSRYPNKLNTSDVNAIIHWNRLKHRENRKKNNDAMDDGLYVSATGPLTYDIVKPYQLNHRKTIDMQAIPQMSKKLLEISVREVKIHEGNSTEIIKITSVSILYKEKIICKISSPFNRKLYKLLINNVTENSNNLSIRVQTRDNCYSNLPLPLPTRCVKDRKLEIDFAINDTTGSMYSGTLICTISLSIRNNSDQQNINNQSAQIYKLTNDPNDPQNSLSLIRRRKVFNKKAINYFSLEDPALNLNTFNDYQPSNINKNEKIQPPNIVILEQSCFSLWDIPLNNWMQAKRPLRPSSPTDTLKIRDGLDEILTITILRGVEIPVRDDSGTVQPLIQIQWGDIIHYTTAVDGPTPVWQQTVHFGIPKGQTELGVKLSLFDQHPIWGLQWLGEATIPLESYTNYQEIERWIGLSSLCSPVHRFGYVQNNNSNNFHTTRIYVLLKMKRLNNEETCDKNSLNTLCKSIQRCMVIPYKINGINNCDDAAKLAMLLTPLPTRYGPLNPRQALKLNKVDYYGRAALLATLLQGLGSDSYVVIGTSQARKWAAFVLLINDSKTSKNKICIWDPENGDNECSLGDSRCSLIKITRLINHQNIWKNLQKTTVLSNIRLNLKNSKDWQPLGQITASMTATSAPSRDSQILDLEITGELIDENTWMEIENDLKDKLSICRSRMGFTTVFNRHAASILRKFLGNLTNPTDSDSSSDKNIMKQLYRAYYIHGFVLNLRFMSRDELIKLFLSTKIHEITGAIEFALVCNVQHYVGKTLSLWLAVVVLKNRE
ncbi:hypothetical protein PV327_006458 [Microctonus hyperodae]|uniref:C2 domain-containing protein n=1 Tax=Microctonus hyperodae TaxID=165561 RepID=A0AA39KIF4_MICHY|nr:hypothetical protein PV327_006458 [Microctonus hyperodae]